MQRKRRSRNSFRSRSSRRSRSRSRSRSSRRSRSRSCRHSRSRSRRHSRNSFRSRSSRRSRSRKRSNRRRFLQMVNPLKNKYRRIQFYTKIDAPTDIKDVLRELGEDEMKEKHKDKGYELKNNAITKLYELLRFLYRYSLYHLYGGSDIAEIATGLLILLLSMIERNTKETMFLRIFWVYRDLSETNIFIKGILRCVISFKKFPTFERVIECVQKIDGTNRDWKPFISDEDIRRDPYLGKIYDGLRDCGEELLPQLLTEYLQILDKLLVGKEDTKFWRKTAEGDIRLTKLIKTTKQVIQHILTHIKLVNVLDDITEVGLQPNRILQTGIVDTTGFEEGPTFVDNNSGL